MLTDIQAAFERLRKNEYRSYAYASSSGYQGPFFPDQQLDVNGANMSKSQRSIGYLRRYKGSIGRDRMQSTLAALRKKQKEQAARKLRKMLAKENTTPVE